MNDFKLDNYPKIETGFKIPDNYFDDFSSKILLQLPENKPKVISIFSKRKTWIYAAAAVLVLGISIPISNQLLKSNEIDDSNIENYVSHNSTISDTDLASLLEEEDLNNIQLDTNTDDETIENELINNKNIEQYLTE